MYEEVSADSLVMEVKANVPLSYTDNCEIVMFRPRDGGHEHFCLIFEKQEKWKNPPGLIHSSEYTVSVLLGIS